MGTLLSGRTTAVLMCKNKWEAKASPHRWMLMLWHWGLNLCTNILLLQAPTTPCQNTMSNKEAALQ